MRVSKDPTYLSLSSQNSFSLRVCIREALGLPLLYPACMLYIGLDYPLDGGIEAVFQYKEGGLEGRDGFTVYPNLIRPSAGVSALLRTTAMKPGARYLCSCLPGELRIEIPDCPGFNNVLEEYIVCKALRARTHVVPSELRRDGEVVLRIPPEIARAFDLGRQPGIVLLSQVDVAGAPCVAIRHAGPTPAGYRPGAALYWVQKNGMTTLECEIPTESGVMYCGLDENEWRTVP